MSIFNKIINKLSSKTSLYQTPHLNFEYTAKSLHVKSQQKSIEVLQKQKKLKLKHLENAKKRQSELNEKMLTHVLSENEMEIFSNSFLDIERANAVLERIKHQEQLLYKSPETTL